MTRFAGEARGSIALLTVVLLPVLLVAVVGVLDLGAARVVAERARIAADLATVAAVNEQDQVELARTGLLRAAAGADLVAREHLALGLASLAASLADTPARIAASADVVVLGPADADPATGRRYGAPTVRMSVGLPIRTPAFGVLLGRPVTIARLFSASSAR